MEHVNTLDFPVDGTRQTYHVAGRGPLCVAHPGGPGLHWSYLRSPDLEERFTVAYLEPAGTGRSDPPASYTLDAYARILAAFVEHLGDGPVHLLGHSYGGFVVQTYALTHPERVAGLILYSTSPEAGPGFWADAAAGVAAYPSRHPGVPEAATVPDSFQQAVAATDDDTLSRLFAAAVPVYFADFWSRRSEFEPWRDALRMSARAATAQDPAVFDVRDRLGEIVAPTVIIAGREDFICGPSWAGRLARGITGARLRILEHTGHFAHIEQPAAFASAAAEILPH